MPKPAPGRDFYIATADEIRAGRTTDIYFVRTLDILKKAGRSRANVVAEVTTGALPNSWPWGIFCGLEEVVHLLEGKAVSLWALPEGSVFPPKTPGGIRGGPQIPRSEDSAHRARRHLLRREDGGIDGRRGDSGPLWYPPRYSGLTTREPRRDCPRSALGTGSPRPQGREDFRVGLRGREVDTRTPGGWRRRLRRRHELEQRSDD